ncbi:MAG: hypothetical protein LBJ58_00970 [Tannerellaceae bacterium]|jgi:hypothetical protein|nr:hypothetical protein [Tannerellaceae bacterium]
MKTTEKELNEQESLRLITDMITQAKERFQQKNGNGIIFWGYAIMVLALADFVLLQTLEEESRRYAFLVWACVLPLFAVHYFLEARKVRHGAYAANHLDKVIGQTWMALLITAMIFVAASFILAGVFRESHGWIIFLLINPAIMSITGLSLFLNGKICRFRPFMYGAIVFWAGALISALIMMAWNMLSLQFLVLATCMIFGFIIPGHILNREAKQYV